MPNEIGSRVRYGEAFWRAHHEAWQQSALNQREYCETPGVTDFGGEQSRAGARGSRSTTGAGRHRGSRRRAFLDSIKP